MPHIAAESGAGTALSFGAVLQALREEFPEVTASRVRFLEAEGLVRPSRSPAGARKFDDSDVERLRHVLRLQRDHCLPLSAVRATVSPEEGEPVRTSEAGAQASACGAPAESAARYGRADLAAEVGVSEEQLAEWESYGLLRPDVEGQFDAGQLAVAGLVAEVGRFGLQPRHLRAVKAAAEREAALVEQLAAPLRLHGNPERRARGEEELRELAGLASRLHSAFVEAALGPRGA
ncbi:MerR family transcriptional regulator [Streptomyces xiaopingdaonensis]|uniref:transcriptional regulator FtsR n=1 Tax=Streptomyces xiaopingdaonensis TaxID=1565415 RepID=UPI000307A351|nr:MerR family transcriptional regulator [Streptomyces xiaopingdaonensis]